MDATARICFPYNFMDNCKESLQRFYELVLWSTIFSFFLVYNPFLFILYDVILFISTSFWLLLLLIFYLFSLSISFFTMPCFLVDRTNSASVVMVKSCLKTSNTDSLLKKIDNFLLSIWYDDQVRKSYGDRIGYRV